jgi:hypothetical protein
MKSKLAAGLIVVLLYLGLAISWADPVGDPMIFSARLDVHTARRGNTSNGASYSATCSGYPNGIDTSGQPLDPCFR